MSILVSGGTGFIGKYLLHFLSSCDIDVISLVRNVDFNGFKSTLDTRISEFHFSDIHQIENEIEWKEIDYTINLATSYKPFEDKSFILDAFNSNILLPSLLIKNCFKYEVPLITFGTYHQELNKNVKNGSFYLQTKISIHNMLEGLANISNFKYVELILNDTYGIGDNRSKILDLILKSFKGDLLKTTPGDQLINLINVKDICRAVYQLIVDLEKGNLEFNQSIGIRSAKFLSIKDLAKICEDIKGKCANIEWGSLQYRGNEIFKEPNLSPVLPNWHEKISLREGISEVIQHNDY